ncbi:MAG: TfuA-like protein [Dehalococcoidia bacterium]
MSVYIFAGPTLSAADARTELDAVYLPPAEQGDVYRVALRRPEAIGIVDGYFERVPAVWHKEILWAMREGIHVFGSASMGALRAAELAPFGMQGVGRIFEAFRDGVLEDDDEVAVAHESAESGYAGLSEALVNIRGTLAAAVSAGIITATTCDALIGIAKRLFYPDRSYGGVLRLGTEAGIAATELEVLRDWLPRGRINQKREDALAMLRVMREHLAGRPGPKRVRYTFEHTIWWDHAVRHAGAVTLHGTDGPETVLIDAVLDELRLDPDAYVRMHERATVRQLALEEASRRRYVAAPEAVRETADNFRREYELTETAAIERWLEENHLSLTEFERLMREETLIGSVRSMIEQDVVRRLPDQIRGAGAYARLAERARQKHRLLREQGLQNPSVQDAGLSRAELVAWHCARQGRPLPLPLNLAWYAAALGFPDEEAFILALLRDYVYEQQEQIDRCGPASGAAVIP